MKRLVTAAVLALTFTAGAALATGFEDTILASYTSAGYSNIVVQHQNTQWIVTADINGASHTFIVNPITGQSTDVTGTDPSTLVSGGTGADDNGTETETESGSDDNGSGSGESHSGNGGNGGGDSNGGGSDD